MDMNQSDGILNQGNILKKDYNTPCERCKNNKSTLLCNECKPFHYYCNQCDTSIHELPSRKHHHRISIDSFQNSSYFQKTNEKSTQNVTKNMHITPKNIHQNSLSLNYSHINSTDYIYDINDNKLNNNTQPLGNPPKLEESKYSYIYNRNTTAIGIGADECKKVYSRDYVNELKIMHDKEKEELLYKITILENTINKIKSSFHDQMSKIKFTQVATEKECNDKIDYLKIEYDAKISNLQKEIEYKDKEISNLNQLILKQRTLNEKISSSYEELKDNYMSLQNEHKTLNKEYNLLENRSKQDYESLNQKIIKEMNSYDQFKEEANLNLKNLINEKEKAINDILHQKELEIKELNLEHKENLRNELDNLTKTLSEKYEKIIKEISEENNILQQDNVLLVEKLNNTEKEIKQNNETYDSNIKKLKNEIEEKDKKISELNKTLDDINYNSSESKLVINDLQSQNNELKQKLDEKNKEIKNWEEKYLVLNNEMKTAQSANELFLDKIKKLQDENRKIKVDYDAASVEYENKLKSYQFIEERNKMLENENEQLKIKMDRYIRPLSFNYIYAQK